MGTELTKNDLRFQRLCPAAIHPASNVKGRPSANKMAARKLRRSNKSKISNAELSPTRTRKFAFTSTLNTPKSTKTEAQSRSRGPDARKQRRPQLTKPM